MAKVEYGSLPFDEQIRFFQDKGLVPTERWNDLWKEAHDSGFMVAGAMKADLLADLKAAMDKAISQGTTFSEFRSDFDSIVARHGWTGWTGEGSEAGRAWRTRVIYDTNLRTSYQAGRWAQVQRVKDRRPYLIYRHSDSVVHPRPLHLSWNGLVVRADGSWVQTHWPPNGWGCKCRMFSLSDSDLGDMGKSGPDTPPDDGTYTWTDKVTGEVHTVPKGIDPGWDYAPGASRVDLLKKQIDRKVKTLPPEIGKALAKDVEKVPTAPSPPAATPVSRALKLPKSGKLAAELQATLEAVDTLHGDGVLPKISVASTRAKGYYGQYRFTLDGRAQDMQISTHSAYPGLTLAHEIGHFLDHQAMGKTGAFDYSDPMWSDWMDAVDNSAAVQALRAQPRSRMRDYYLKPWEKWARSYAQWVATRSRRRELLDAVSRIRASGDTLYRNSQWDDADFEQIAKAIDAMFRKLGWM